MKNTSHFSKYSRAIVVGLLCVSSTFLYAQTDDDRIVEQIIKEATEHSKLEDYAFELIDVIGPRLVGTPQMKQAHDWVKDKYTSLGFEARNEAYGTWKAWERGVTTIAMTNPRIQSLEGRQLAWSPATSKKGVEAEVVILPESANAAEFKELLKQVKGKFVLISKNTLSGRPDYQWKEYATTASYENYKANQAEVDEAWSKRISNTGYSLKELPKVLEEAGAAGVLMSYWTGIMGANRVFGAETKKVPTVDLSVEDYGSLYRLAERGQKPRIRLQADSKDLGVTETYNTIAELKGSEKADEYVILSAHLDSWDGATGATDNGTGIVTMMEAARILKKVLPNPKRTILIGNWGSEEQGLNGSRAFVADHPELHNKIQVLLNQDSGTGRIVGLSGQGFLNAYSFLGDWLQAVPNTFKKDLKTHFPGTPSSGGSDHASFVSAGIPAFMLSSLNWGYGGYTWHTNRDTYDKIVFDDIRSNAILIAILAYKASEAEELVSRERIELPLQENGKRATWPEIKQPQRATPK